MKKTSLPKNPAGLQPSVFLEHARFNVSGGIVGDEVEVIRVIRTNLVHRGKGVEGDPVRRITQYWDMDGNLLWETDPKDDVILSRAR